jgi:hypothetical protein
VLPGLLNVSGIGIPLPAGDIVLVLATALANVRTEVDTVSVIALESVKLPYIVPVDVAAQVPAQPEANETLFAAYEAVPKNVNE